MAADELGLPTVINSALPLAGTHFFLDGKNPSHTSRHKACCGCLCLWPDGMDFARLMMSKTMNVKNFFEVSWTMNKRQVISTTFWGFDKAIHLPPNVVLTGPMLSPDLSSALSRLYVVNEPLGAWLDEAEAANETVIYISLGSEVYWMQWYVDNILKGVEMVTQKGKPVRVIWSIK